MSTIRFCERHALRIIEAVEARGLGPLRKGRAGFLASAMEQALLGRETRASFEPVLHASLAVARDAELLGGVVLHAGDAEGRPRCPACFCVEIGGAELEGWIDRAAASAERAALALGFGGVVLGAHRAQLVAILGTRLGLGAFVPGSDDDLRELQAALAETDAIEPTPEELRRWAETGECPESLETLLSPEPSFIDGSGV